jgi:hypothetical protein
MFLLARDGKNVAMILNIKWKRTPSESSSKGAWP